MFVLLITDIVKKNKVVSIDSSGAPCRLVEECWDDPLTCTTSYVSPDSQPKETSIQQFKDFIVNSFVEKIVPLVMVKVCYFQYIVLYKIETIEMICYISIKHCLFEFH